ncbi:acyltransferase [Paraburkholderia sp. J7]|uniref:acyltransferase family protein n=1 Tax=Paraburkholderia sp. J7 TaxID=2805438 RepID=UPI002AB7E2C5|nr:acyltransferase [Paraburkholderia sp. J7]
MKNNSGRGANGKIDYLEALRFILACLTMAWHYYYFGPLLGVIGAAPLHLPGLRYCSFGVDIFFVLSGFIIIGSALTRTAGEFLTNRLVRLGPCLLICAPITFAATFAAGYSPSLPSLLSSILVLPLPVVAGVDWSYWSLGTLVTFYVIVFVAMQLVDIGKHITTLALLLTLFSAVTLLPGFPLKASPTSPFPFERYAPYFAAGMLLHLIITKRRFSAGVLVTLAVTFVLIAIRSWMDAARISELFTNTSPAPVSGPVMALAALGIFICFTRKANYAWLKRLYSVLGRTAYPIYLIHQNLGYMLISFAEKRLHLSLDVRPLVMACMVALSLGIAVYLEPHLAVRYRRLANYLVSAKRPLSARMDGSKATVRDAE